MSQGREVRIGARESIGPTGLRHGVIYAVDQKDGYVALTEGVQCGQPVI